MRFLLLFCFLLFADGLIAQDITSDLRKIFPNAKILLLPASNHYQLEYIITFPQFLDHSDTTKGTFPHRIFLSHHDFDSPMVMNISGYAANYETTELSTLFSSNQLIIEYRFYGKSKPDSIDFKYLTNKQAIQDIHRIQTKLKLLYQKQWISTGISKGGTTCLIHKAFYPDPIEATVVYNAPMMLDSINTRFNESIHQLGNEKLRQEILDFQKGSMRAIDSLETLVKMDFPSCSYDRIGGIYNALQYAILDFPYIYWQMGHSRALFFNLNSTHDYYNVLRSVVDLSKYCDHTILQNQNAYYQFFNENGFYDHSLLMKETIGVKGLNSAKHIFLDRKLHVQHNPEIIIAAYNLLNNKCNKIIQINGENDPWLSTTWKPNKENENYYFIIKDGPHNSKINNLNKNDKLIFYKKMNKWLNIKMND